MIGWIELFYLRQDKLPEQNCLNTRGEFSVSMKAKLKLRAEQCMKYAFAAITFVFVWR